MFFMTIDTVEESTSNKMYTIFFRLVLQLFIFRVGFRK